jgi:hypothetical protein
MTMAAKYKHADPVHLEFGRSADSKLLTKQRRTKNYADGGLVESNTDVFPRMREQKPTINLDARVPDPGTYPVGLRGFGEGPIPTYMAPQNMDAIPSEPGVKDVRGRASPISDDPSIPLKQRIRGY